MNNQQRPKGKRRLKQKVSRSKKKLFKIRQIQLKEKLLITKMTLKQKIVLSKLIKTIANYQMDQVNSVQMYQTDQIRWHFCLSRLLKMAKMSVCLFRGLGQTYPGNKTKVWLLSE